MPDFDMSLARRFVELTRRRSELTAEEDSVKRELARVNEKLLEQFAQAGPQSVRIDGYTVYLHRDLRARVPQGGTKGDACDALRAAGLHDYVEEAFNHNSVSALFREWDRAGEPPPEELAGRLEAIELFSVRARRS